MQMNINTPPLPNEWLYNITITYLDGYVTTYTTDILFMHGLNLPEHGGRPIRIDVYTSEVPTSLELRDLHKQLKPADSQGVVIHHTWRKQLLRA